MMSLKITITVLNFALSRTPHTSSTVMANTMSAARMLNTNGLPKIIGATSLIFPSASVVR